jgi:hypothetical protein
MCTSSRQNPLEETMASGAEFFSSSDKEQIMIRHRASRITAQNFEGPQERDASRESERMEPIV